MGRIDGLLYLMHRLVKEKASRMGLPNTTCAGDILQSGSGVLRAWSNARRRPSLFRDPVGPTLSISMRFAFLTMLFEILTVDNVGIDTKTKSLDSLIRKIFVIVRFHIISMLIKSIAQNAMDKILYEILTVENVGIDTKMKSLDNLIWKLFVIE